MKFSRKIAIAALAVLLAAIPAAAQQNDQPVIVQPGPPGAPSKVLPANTRAVLPPTSKKDVEFMQGMIMHHAQAVEMVSFIESNTKNKKLRLLGSRIGLSQADEMAFMKRWLAVRGQSESMPGTMMMSDGMEMTSHSTVTMPGMLTTAQMIELKVATGAEFDRLFLKGMIQHHNGALIMVKELFESGGTGQDAELFTFASDVDSGQRAEIRAMEAMLDKKR